MSRLQKNRFATRSSASRIDWMQVALAAIAVGLASGSVVADEPPASTVSGQAIVGLMPELSRPVDSPLTVRPAPPLLEVRRSQAPSALHDSSTDRPLDGSMIAPVSGVEHGDNQLIFVSPNNQSAADQMPDELPNPASVPSDGATMDSPLIFLAPTSSDEQPPADLPSEPSPSQERQAPSAPSMDEELASPDQSPTAPLPTFRSPIAHEVDPGGDEPGGDRLSDESLHSGSAVDSGPIYDAEPSYDAGPVIEFGSPVVPDSSVAPESGALMGESTTEDRQIPSPPAGAWWDTFIGQPLRHSSQPRPVSITSLINAALQYSSRIRVLSDSPLIRDTAIIEADAEFDWTAFMETSWNDIDEPVGSTLTTGGPPRFSNEFFDYEIGGRRKNLFGGQFEASQQYGYERSNSVFFVPNDQGTSRLTLSYSQPLLRNAGRVVNTSTILLTQIQSGIARDEFSRDLQDHLLEVTQAYWNLYLDRGALLQRQRLYKRGKLILSDLEVREGLDAVANQIVRARAAVATRRSNLYRAAASVKNAEGRLRTLVNAPGLGIVDEFELTPLDFPATYAIPINLHDAFQAAVRHRPEIRQSLKEIKASALRLDVTKNELLPILDVVLDTYVNGLRGSSQIGGSFVDQFGDGAPSYSAGLRFEVPIRNRAARARFQRRALELRQFQHQFRNTVQVLQLEVEIAVRDTLTAYREIAAKLQSMRAAESEVDFLTHRWELMPGEDRSTSLILEDLLTAQDRLAQQEFDYLDAQVQYNISLVNLKKATGTLLQFEQIQLGKTKIDGIPQLELMRNQPMARRASAPRPTAKHLTAPTHPTAPSTASAVAPVNHIEAPRR